MEPQIVASFDLDSEGNPEAIQANDLRHYKIRLHVEGVPDETYAVTYGLHNTYFNPLRESTAKDKAFEEALTSYGDYSVRAKIRTTDGAYSISRNLTDALAAGYGSRTSDAVRAAIEDLRKK